MRVAVIVGDCSVREPAGQSDAGFLFALHGIDALARTVESTLAHCVRAAQKAAERYERARSSFSSERSANTALRRADLASAQRLTA